MAANTIGDIPEDGWFQKFTRIIETSILGLDRQLAKAGVRGSMGISIVLFTLAIKTVLFPVNFAQLKSSVKMQAVQPKVKEIQARYKDEPQQMNLMYASVLRALSSYTIIANCHTFYAK